MSRNNVLIIGAGPAGLFVAAELARHGVSSRIVEQTTRPHHEARATSIKPGAMEMLDAGGVLQPFLDVAQSLRGTRMYDEDLTELRASSYDGLDCRFDFMLQLPQYETLRILEDRLVALGGRVERGVTAREIEGDADEELVVELVQTGDRVETVRPDVLIGAGGAHSVTRHAMVETLEGDTYPGRFLVADIAMEVPFARDEAVYVFGPRGFQQLAALPDERWISFLQLAEDERVTTADEVAAGIEQRLGGRFRPSDVAWFSTYEMQRRLVSRLADGRRFLIGDAAHLSSTFAGQGQNAALQDGYDLAWKLALVLRGHGRRALLDAYAVERRMADRHALDVSDDMHRAVIGAADKIRRTGTLPPAHTDPVAAALQRDAGAMIDIDYAGSPLVVDHADPPAARIGPHPGQRYPDWNRFGGTAHHALVFGPVDDPAALARLGRRWSELVVVAHDPAVDPGRAGVPDGGVALIRPDGHIGFRSPSADPEALAALDRHLSSYLIPDPAAGPARENKGTA